MLTIEIKERVVEDENGSKTKEKYVAVNGIVDLESFYLETIAPYAHLYNDEIIGILQSHSFKEVGQHFAQFSFNDEIDEWENWLKIDVHCDKYFDDEIFPKIQITLVVQEWEHWAKPWSIADLATEFQAAILDLNNEKLKYWQEDEESVLNGFGIEYFPNNLNLTIQNEINIVLELLARAIENTNKALLLSVDSNEIVTYFQFPEEIKTACSQYLVYFAQFLADIGIAVDTELKQEVNRTLFKIIPQDENQSLERIEEALNIYLNTPNDNVSQNQMANHSDISVKQWEANIFHLKSQLLLASSVIQAKDATIEALQLSNYQYKQLIESNTKGNDKEDIIKGVVAVKEIEGTGFSINLPEILRRLKRKFNK